MLSKIASLLYFNSLFEQRQDIDIDFSNLNESINTLVKLYDANYWANFQQ